MHVGQLGCVMTRSAKPLPIFDSLDPTRMWATLATGSHTANRAMPILQAAIDSARLGPVTMADVASRAGVAATTVYRYFSDIPSLEGIAHLILLEESLLVQSAWAHPDNTAAWDADSVDHTLGHWASSLAASTHGGMEQVRSVATIRAVPELDSHLTAAMQRAAHRVAGRLRDWQARSLITDDVDPFVQSLFMQNLHLSGWFRRLRRHDDDHHGDDPRWRSLLAMVAHDVQRPGPRRVLATGTWFGNSGRHGQLPPAPALLDIELERILTIEIGDPSPVHDRVVRSALTLTLASPISDFTITDLHEHSGVPPKRIYELFSGKEQIRRVGLWAFASATVAAHIGLLRHLPDADDPQTFLSDMLQRFAEPDAMLNRAHRLQGVSSLYSLSARHNHLAHLIDITSQATDALAQVQREGRLSDRVPADTVVDLLAGMTMSRAVIDTIGDQLPDAAWGWQLDATFGELLGTD